MSLGHGATPLPRSRPGNLEFGVFAYAARRVNGGAVATADLRAGTLRLYLMCP